MKLRLILLLTLAAGANRSLAADLKAPAAAVPPPAANAAAPKPAATAPGTAAAAAPRKEPSVAPAATFDTFRVITDRNIFNPNRTARRDRVAEEAPPRLDLITLVGTMDSDKGLRAFFEGSDPAYRKALVTGGTVESFKVIKIAPNTVDLEREGKTFSVRVGQQLRRPEGGEWNLTDNQSRGAALADPARPSAAAPAAIPADASDTVRRMMERRNQNLKN